MRIKSWSSWLAAALAVLACGINPARAADLDVPAPDKTTPLEPRKPERARWTWNQAKATVTATGDIEWKPEPFKYKPGPSVRYIDFENGSDESSGDSREAPWKHHPWDAAASGKAHDCKGAMTYVFKRGVVYRGELRGAESGSEQTPIQLTSDPAWGKGEAVISGAVPVTGWKLGASNKDIPNGEKVWMADVTYLPKNLFEIQQGKLERIPLARWPHWKVSDPEDVMSEWWQWEQPEWWTSKNVVTRPQGKAHLGVDTKNLTQAADVYKGAVVRSEFGIVMGTPFPSRVEDFDPAKKAVVFQGIWFGDSEKIITGNRYYLEDKPQFLDAPGEFFVEQHDQGARIYVRLTGDRDPNKTTIEAARFINLIESDGMSHVHISGLSFRETNTHWDLTQPAWGHKDVNNACIRIQGSADDVHVTNCSFEQAGKAVLIATTKPDQTLDNLVIADNDMQYIDHGAISVDKGPGQFGDIKVLRNHLFMIGQRPFRQDWGHALSIGFPVTMEIAGNVIDRGYGAGIWVFGGKASGDARETPLARNLIYNNKVTNTLLSANDWGEIETWQGGPFYVYNNIAGNPVGYWNWAYNKAKPASARLGFAYYLDGGYKNYHFNNVAWGNSNDLTSKECAASAFYEAGQTTYNSYFNNTIYNFSNASHWSPGGGRHLFLGNLFLDISSWVFVHGPLKEDKPDTKALPYPYPTDAYGHNFYLNPSPTEFAIFESTGAKHSTYDSFKTALAANKVLSADGGGMLKASPVVDEKAHDFHLKAGSPPIDQGVTVFVPWALARTVGEWQFRRNQADPSVLLDDHWYMTPYYFNRDDFFKVPAFSLKAANAKADDYIASPTENWTHGALKFNGKDQFATLTQQEMTQPYTYPGPENKQLTVSGADVASPDVGTTNLTLEVCFQTEPGSASTVLVSKLADSGYQLAINKAGTLTFSVKAGAQNAAVASTAKINDGKWHHALAELDRQAKTATIYVDGKAAGQSSITLAESDSLANGADLLVGKGANGSFFAGAIDFLRIARSSLKESRTTIEELYDWEFDGPFLRDFAGHDAAGASRDAGAFEFTGGK